MPQTETVHFYANQLPNEATEIIFQSNSTENRIGYLHESKSSEFDGGGTPLETKSESIHDDYQKGLDFLSQFNFVEARKYFEKSHSQGYLPAHVKLVMLQSWTLTRVAPFIIAKSKSKLSEATTWHEQQLKLNPKNDDFLLNLALCYHSQAKEPSKIWLCLESISHRNAFTLFLFGTCYENGIHRQQNYKKALEFHITACDLGLSCATNAVGNFYALGCGVTPDSFIATKYYRMGAELGHGWAQHNLALHYQYGRGIEQDYKLALEWVTKALESGCEGASRLLSSMYDVKQNL